MSKTTSAYKKTIENKYPDGLLTIIRRVQPMSRKGRDQWPRGLKQKVRKIVYEPVQKGCVLIPLEYLKNRKTLTRFLFVRYGKGIYSILGFRYWVGKDSRRRGRGKWVFTGLCKIDVISYEESMFFYSRFGRYGFWEG